MELTTDLLARIAGWEAVKQARGLVASGRVRESEWSPPLLQGVVQEGSTVYRTGLRIRNAADAETLCTCRRARADGMVCAHAIAVGLHWLATRAPASAPASRSTGSGSPAGPSSETVTAPPSATGLPRTLAGAEGPSLRLHVVVPPNLGHAFTQGRVSFTFEAEVRGGRRPLNALPRHSTWTVGTEDAAVLDAAERLAQGETPAVLGVGAREADLLLRSLVGHPRVTLGRDRPLAILAEPWTPRLRAQLDPTGEIRLSLESPLPPVLRGGEVDWCLDAATVRPLELPTGCQDVLRGPVRLGRPRVPGFLMEVGGELGADGRIRADFRVADFRIETQPPQVRVTLSGSMNRLQARGVFRYGAVEVEVASLAPGAGAEAAVLPDPKDPRRYVVRHEGIEREVRARLVRAGFRAVGREGLWVLEGEGAGWTFLAREHARWVREWEIVLDASLAQFAAQRVVRVEPRLEIRSSGQDWFDLSVAYAASGGAVVSREEIDRLIRSGQSHARLKDGRVALLDTGGVGDLEEVLRDCDPQQEAGSYRIASAHAGYVAATAGEQPGWQLRAPGEWLARVRRLSGAVALTVPALGALEVVLRPYQKQGVAWLWWLRQQGFGGILADEMGLGKTLQTLALIWLAREARSAAGSRPAESTRDASAPFLVVCPTSLVFNWVAEAHRFLPELKLQVLEGPDRARDFDGIPRADLVITSYALLRRDLERYGAYAFDTVVLDEAQHIRNRQTQNARAVKGIRTRHRLVLTGTPIENSVLDLWSIFDFLMPGYLGSAADFRDRYETPVVRGGEDAVQRRLSRRVRPFVMRRRKRDVVPELPPRLEQVAYCELLPEQQTLYRQLQEAGRAEVLAAVGKDGLARSRPVILTALLRLRQVCCDPRLLDLGTTAAPPGSAKMELFDELLDEALDGDHRLLVFSQFTRLLGLLRERLAAREVPFCYLDGSTADRAGVVRRFQSGPDLPVFLISLKAGGTGLNLTGADTVVVFDPWWNPAAEAQAADRAHRIGQTRVVTTYKLIARGTVEEKILQLQARKQALAQAAMGGDEALAGAWSWEEIEELLA